jgi:predicted esterase
MLQQHQLTVSRTAHYATLGQAGPHIRNLWLVCHGYGQLARRFIRAFAAIQDEETLVVAPEGLSRFYWGGFDGPVVASWMTREDRLDEIADFSRLMSQLYELYVPRCHPAVRIILLGFSQGAATQVRWIMRAFPRFDHLLLWAGQLPEDLDYSPHQVYFQDKSLHFAHGDADPFITPERLAKMREYLDQSGLAYEEFPFAGDHRIVPEALQAWRYQILTTPDTP